jgi:sulfonate transport system substrate-binding protein
VDELTAMIADPDNVWTTTPAQVTRFLEFMHKVGSVKKRPRSWQDLFMPESHGLAGS